MKRGGDLAKCYMSWYELPVFTATIDVQLKVSAMHTTALTQTLDRQTPDTKNSRWQTLDIISIGDNKT